MALTRSAILGELKRGEHLTANEIAAKLEVPWHAVYRELKTLEKQGKVRKEPIRWFKYG